MARRSAFEIFLIDVESAIEAETSSGKGQHRRRDALRRRLVEWAVYSRTDGLALKGMTGRFADIDARRAQVACALHAMHRHGFSAVRAAATACRPREKLPVTVRDLHAVQRLARRAQVSLAELDGSVHEFIKVAVSTHVERLIVRLDARAVEDLLLAALEAYAVPKPGRGQRYTEVYGYCFGSRRDLPPEGRDQRFRRILAVSRVVTQLRVHADAGSFISNDASERVHMNVATHFFEHLTLIGNYHTHPWRSLNVLRDGRKPWEYSKHDERHMDWWAKKAREAGGEPRFSLIAAIGKGGRQGHAAAREDRNRVRLCVDGTFVILAAYRLKDDDTYDKDIALQVPDVPNP